jgi:ribokinase
LGAVLVVGSYNASLTVFSDRLPQRGQTVLGQGFDIGPGGKGNNQAIAAKRLGADVTFLVKVGGDEFGVAARERFAHEGLPSAGVLRGDQHTGVALIMVDALGDNLISVAPGANSELDVGDVVRISPLLSKTTHLLCQLECRLELFRDVARWSRQRGLTTILNPAPAAPLDDETCQLVDLLTPNESELAVLVGPDGFGDRPLDKHLVVESARSLVRRGVGQVIVTLGERGAVHVTAAGDRWFDAYPVEAVDSTGAGDAFNGGLVAALAADLELANAIDLGMRAGAFCVTKPGVVAGLATPAELDAAIPPRNGGVRR